MKRAFQFCILVRMKVFLELFQCTLVKMSVSIILHFHIKFAMPNDYQVIINCVNNVANKLLQTQPNLSQKLLYTSEIYF